VGGGILSFEQRHPFLPFADKNNTKSDLERKKIFFEILGTKRPRSRQEE
jgi:hypothetical protein